MNTRDELASIGRRVVDCRSYNFGMRNADKLAHEDAPALLSALDAVLALADGWKKEFTGQSEGESMLRAAAYMVRAAVNDALEAGK